MKPLLPFAVLLFSQAAFAGAMPDYGTAKLGNDQRSYNVKSCDLLMPHLGSSQERVETELRALGFRPHATPLLKNVAKHKLALIELSTRDTLDHNDSSLEGTPYLRVEGWVASLGTSSELTLVMSVVGEPGAYVFEASKYKLLPGMMPGAPYKTNGLPRCQD